MYNGIGFSWILLKPEVKPGQTMASIGSNNLSRYKPIIRTDSYNSVAAA